MWEGISGLITLVVLVLKLWINNQSEEKVRKEALHAQLSDAIKRGDVVAINDLLDKLHT